MSAEIFNAPGEVKLPPTVFQDYKNWEKNENDYIERLKTYLKNDGYTGKNVGEIIRFPVCDGYALYMVLSMRPLRLIHLELGDCWSFQYDYLLTAKEVNQKIDGMKRMDELFRRNAESKKK